MEQHEGFSIRHAADKAAIDAIWKDDRYGVREIAKSVDKEGLCIDLGAGIGAFSRLWHDFHPSSPIASVECDQRTFAILESNVKGFAMPICATCTYLQWRPMKPHKKVGLMEIVDELSKPTTPYPQQVVQPKRGIAVIRFNVGGFEHEILNGVMDSVMERTHCVIVDVHGGMEGEKRLQEVFARRFGYWFIDEVVDDGFLKARNPYYHFRKKCE